MPIGAFISGCSGYQLTNDELAFFRDAQPWGLILFKRNIESPDQVRTLTASFREAIGRRNAPVLTDQEGGRVQRMAQPHWRSYPSARRYGLQFEENPLTALRAARMIARLIAEELVEVGINVDCLPVLDVPVPGSSDVIGDRAYSEMPERVIVLARAAMTGLMSGGVLPVIKHMPGHGRAAVDSHNSLPVVGVSKKDLELADFATFAAFADAPLAMTAHVVYSAVDNERPATQSRKMIRYIRKEIGFEGLLMTDDLSMKALAGDMTERVKRAIDAGCDLALHCNGNFLEMQDVAAAAGELKGKALRRAKAALKQLRKPAKFDRMQALKVLEQMLLVEA
jgi:beta-N-acetylhexosaminidase